MNTKINVVIPMAGLGDRMKQAGYTDSKPMIDVLGKPMIEWVVENINLDNATYLFIVQANDYIRYDLGKFLPTIVPRNSKCVIHTINGLTDGAASTILTARRLFSDDKPLLIVNSDQIIDWEHDPFGNLDNVDGCVFCFKADHPRFSYAKVDDNGKIIEVAEKKVISDNATAGAYYWKRGEDFVDAACAMIRENDRVNGEFYTAPVYNYSHGRTHVIRSVYGVSHLGTPEELSEYVAVNGKSHAQT